MKHPTIIIVGIIFITMTVGSLRLHAVDAEKDVESLRNPKTLFANPDLYEFFAQKDMREMAKGLKNPEWSFALDTTACRAGEQIIGRLFVKNIDTKYSFIFAAPAHGSLADNIEIWFRTKGSNEELQRASFFLKHLVGGRDGIVRSGERIVLMPGQERSFQISVNMYAMDNMDQRAHQLAGASVMGDPGEFEFYIRYANWGFKGTSPVEGPIHPRKDTIYGWRTEGETTSPKNREGMELRIMPIDWRDIVVLGPFTVKVEPWPTERKNEMAKRIAAAWKCTLDLDHHRILLPPYDQELVREALDVFPPSKNEPNSIGAMLKMQDWIVRYPDFENIRYREGLDKPLPNAEFKDRLTKMLTELRVMKADEKPGILRDLICYWEIRALIDLGERSEALKVAREYSTPDIMALIGARIGLVLDPNWREVGPIRTIPPDDYTAPEVLPPSENVPQPTHGNNSTLPTTPPSHYPSPSAGLKPVPKAESGKTGGTSLEVPWYGIILLCVVFAGIGFALYWALTHRKR